MENLIQSLRPSLEGMLRQVRVNDPPSNPVRAFGEKVYNTNPEYPERAAVAVAIRRREASTFLKRRVQHAKCKIDAANFLRTRAQQYRVKAGPCVGAVRPTSALIWARGASSPGFLQFEVFPTDAFEGEPLFRKFLPCDASTDFAQCAEVTGLAPATRYYVRVEMCREKDSVSTPTNLVAAYADFTTPPTADDVAAVSFVVGMNLQGSGSRAVFQRMLERRPAFAILGGGLLSAMAGERMGYPSPSAKAAAEGDELGALRVMYRAQANDRHARKFFCRTPVWAMGGADCTTPAEVQAFAENWPTSPSSDGSSPSYSKLHGSFRHGALLEVFQLDTRAFHSAAVEGAEAAGEARALGEEQLRWLQEGLVASSAVWKIIVCDVPLLLAGARLRSAGGVSAEAWRAVVGTMRSCDSRNFVWLSHLPSASGAVASVATCDPFGEGLPLCHELSVGALHVPSLFGDVEFDLDVVRDVALLHHHIDVEIPALVSLGESGATVADAIEIATVEGFRPTLVCALVRFVSTSFSSLLSLRQ